MGLLPADGKGVAVIGGVTGLVRIPGTLRKADQLPTRNGFWYQVLAVPSG